MVQQRKKTDVLGKRILNASRTELTLAMPFLAAPLNALSYVMDLSTTTVGTDAAFIRFNPNHLFRLYIEQPARLNRTYLHMLLHCLFGHMFSAPRFTDGDLWNLCCDIAAEAVIDEMDNDAIRRVTSDFRQQVYETLKAKTPVLTAERIYAVLSAGEITDVSFRQAAEAERGTGTLMRFETLEKMAHEFREDDHGFWERMRQEQDGNGEEEENPPPLPGLPLPPAKLRQMKEGWERDARRVKSELDLLSNEASKETGTLSWTLGARYDSRTDYRVFLRKLAVTREEAKPDPDHFDMGLYRYGLSLYGNLPLIEELEVRETRKIDELVIAIDTSASCVREQVQRFLNETASLLKQRETFFHRVDIRIIECDEHVQYELALSDVSELARYADAFTLKGGYGTDFRPVFARIADLRAKGELRHLRALLYFTDGYGDFPKKAPPYETAFVFDTASDFDDRAVPSWAVKLYIHP